MIDLDGLRSIFAIYVKHGWLLRRVLLSPALRASLGPSAADFGGSAVQDSDIDAAWFSRAPAAGGVAWEIRYLSPAPYALVEHIDEFSDSFEADLGAVEARLRQAVAKLK